jgi:hypothetical protein
MRFDRDAFLLLTTALAGCHHAARSGAPSSAPAEKGIAADAARAAADAAPQPEFLTAASRLAFGLANGKGCTAAYELAGTFPRAVLFSDADGWSGWLLRRASDQDASVLSAEPIRCN